MKIHVVWASSRHKSCVRHNSTLVSFSETHSMYSHRHHTLITDIERPKQSLVGYISFILF